MSDGTHGSNDSDSDEKKDKVNKRSSTSGSETGPPNKASKSWYQQSFTNNWLQEPDWIEADSKNKYVVRCKVCDYSLSNANKSSLLTHKMTQKHVKNFELKQQMTNIKTFFTTTKAPSLREQVAKAELLLVAFMAEHNIPFSQADHLVEVMKKMFPDSNVAKYIQMKRTKSSYVMQDGIAREEKEDITKICQNNKFSLIIDESTDISITQILAVVVRYYDEKKCQVVDVFLIVLRLKIQLQKDCIIR